MHQIKNVIFIMSICCLSYTANADEISKITQDNYSTLVVELTEKLAELNKAITRCSKRSEISKKTIQHCKLDETSIDGLLYINLLAENNCTKEIQLEVLSLLVKERNYRRHHNITPDSWSGIKQDTIDFFDANLAHLPLTSDQSVDLEKMFLSISKVQQNNLLSCKELQKPFDILEVVDRLTK